MTRKTIKNSKGPIFDQLFAIALFLEHFVIFGSQRLASIWTKGQKEPYGTLFGKKSYTILHREACRVFSIKMIR